MKDYFEKNRYNFSELIDKIKAMKEVPNIISNFDKVFTKVDGRWIIKRLNS